MIRPLALLGPAKSHPEVIVQAVAARNREKAEKFAKANGIPEVKGSYQGRSMSYLASCGYFSEMIWRFIGTKNLLSS